eukprot:CAMPEP_0176448852 /NCGR_PEP_ID=MMETSP0127-20121128/26076_1 /TAXON_ID=938130 /ORGANISM="Platyophrya macrostoma, Strain WH" /LENGTH=304 /DNA_ID=CAMNT_0017835973 /DNA_START=17 /DNA_END=931 /DNA_ORIENTATION=-
MGGSGGRCAMVAPVLRSTTTDYQRFRLPERPLYGNNVLAKIMPPPKAAGGDSDSPAAAGAAMDASEASVLSNGGGGGGTAGLHRSSSTAASNRLNGSAPARGNATMPSLEALNMVRPWEQYFALFDTNRSGSSDKADILLPMLLASSHVVPLEPEPLKYDSRLAPHMRVMISALTSMLATRRASEGPVRLGEVFALRDFIVNEVMHAKQLTEKEAVSITVTCVPSLSNPQPHTSSSSPSSPSQVIHASSLSETSPKTYRALMQQFDTTMHRMGDFRQAAEDMITRRELLDGPQLASLLQEIVLL